MRKNHNKDKVAIPSLGYDPMDIACFFVNIIDREAGDSITHLKLQKLIYYAQGWHMAIFGKALFEEDFEAWVHGPVSPTVWEEFKGQGWQALPPMEIEKELSDDVKDVLKEVYDVYSNETAKQLEYRTHQELPWREARGNLPPEVSDKTPIHKETMKKFFESLYGQ